MDKNDTIHFSNLFINHHNYILECWNKLKPQFFEVMELMNDFEGLDIKDELFIEKLIKLFENNTFKIQKFIFGYEEYKTRNGDKVEAHIGLHNLYIFLNKNLGYLVNRYENEFEKSRSE